MATDIQWTLLSPSLGLCIPQGSNFAVRSLANHSCRIS